MSVSLHINFNGNCREAFEFYKTVLDGEIGLMLPYKDSPAKDNTPAEWQDKILHANIDIRGLQLAGADLLPEQYLPLNGFNLLISVDTIDEVKTIYEQLAVGGETIMTPQETFWSPCYAIVIDRFAVPWKINCSG